MSVEQTSIDFSLLATSEAFIQKEAGSVKQTKTMANDITFAENFVSQGGKFIYCENTEQFFLFLKSLQEQNSWNYIFSWNPALRNLLSKFEFQKDNPDMLIQSSDAAISFCDSLVAENGVIILSPDQSSNRKLTTFPKHHIIVASQNNLVSTIDEAINVFKNNYFNRLPALLELDESRKVYKSNHSRLLSADGTKDVYVFYIDTPEIG
jgi:L-lactate dehydrogenase complex protein LldG